MRKQSTGEPYALIAPVRFGGRGGESHSYPYPPQAIMFILFFIGCFFLAKCLCPS